MSNNHYDDNFLTSQYDDQADAALESVDAGLQQQTEENHVISEAIRRIEQAKLYEALLRNSLFDPSSARAEIISVVEGEMKGFILSRLENLLGIKPSSPVAAVQAELPFTDDQVQALKALADRMMTKQAPQPSIQSVSEPTVKPLAAPTAASTVGIKAASLPASAAPQGRAPSKPQQAPKAPTGKRQPRKRSENVSAVTGQDYAQSAGEPHIAAQRLRMPSQAEIDQQHAMEAARNSTAMSSSGALIQQAIMLAQKANANVREE